MSAVRPWAKVVYVSSVQVQATGGPLAAYCPAWGNRLSLGILRASVGGGDNKPITIVVSTDNRGDIHRLGPPVWVELCVRSPCDDDVFGSVAIAPGQDQAAYDPADYKEGRYLGSWTWRLKGSDVDRLERLRESQNDPTKALTVIVGVRGVFYVYRQVEQGQRPEAALAHATGTIQVRIPASDWAGLTEAMDVLPESLDLPWSPFMHEPYWRDALARLAEARNTLRRGDGPEALHRCYDVLTALLGERVRQNPLVYNKDHWEKFFDVSEPAPHWPRSAESPYGTGGPVSRCWPASKHTGPPPRATERSRATGADSALGG